MLLWKQVVKDLSALAHISEVKKAETPKSAIIPSTASRLPNKKTTVSTIGPSYNESNGKNVGTNIVKGKAVRIHGATPNYAPNKVLGQSVENVGMENQSFNNEIGGYFKHDEEMRDHSPVPKKAVRDGRKFKMNMGLHIREAMELLNDANLDRRMYEMVNRVLGKVNNRRKRMGYHKPYLNGSPRSFMPKEKQPCCSIEHQDDNQREVTEIILIKVEECGKHVEVSTMATGERDMQIAKTQNSVDKVIPTKSSTGMSCHLKPLFVQGYINGIQVHRMMVNNNVEVNILSASMMKRLGKLSKDLMPTNIVVSTFIRKATDTWEILSINVAMGSQETPTSFFVVETSSSSYSALLDRDWIHVAKCIPSFLYQMFFFFNENKAHVVKADPKAFNGRSTCY
ncbi:hypothetical protein ACH5RR_003101 [Cinchona calisaya]|uniref:Uncharacterized protein n=1 Tax=Cinchona calisaya TaxID=153742 RepID=A0ABD3ATU6_9GENT